MGLTVSPQMRDHAKKLALQRKRKCDKAKTKEARIKRSMTRRRRQMEGAARRQVSKLIRKQLQLDLSMSHRSHESKTTLTAGVEVTDPTNDEDDESDEDDLEPGQVPIAKFQSIIEVKRVRRLLVILDVNETLLHNEWTNKGYRNLVMRPILGKFLPWLLTLGVDVGLWTGSPSVTRQKYLASLLEPYGLPKKKLIVIRRVQKFFYYGSRLKTDKSVENASNKVMILQEE